jgi:site-specific DNA recombinase
MNSVTPDSAESTEGTVAASYERVSTRVQGQSGFSLGAQAKDTAQYAADQGWTLPVALRFRDGEDRRASGADWDLPGLNAMLDAAKRNEFSVLVVPAVDRFARDMAKALVLEQQLRKYGVRVVYIAAPVEDTAEGRLLLRQLQSFAEYEREKITFRTMRGRREKIDRGQVVGNGPAPYGYRYVRKGHPRPRVIDLEPDPLVAPIVARIYREALHRSALEIGTMLAGEHVPPPPGYNRRDPGKRWAPDVVLRILTNPAYAGRLFYGAGEGRRRADFALESEGGVPVPPIVDAGLWQDVQKALQRRQTVRKARRVIDEDPWLLRGLVACGHCDGQLSATWNYSKSTGRYRRYQCLRSRPGYSERYGTTLCPMRDVRAEHLEGAVWSLVSEALMDPQRLNAGLESARAQHDQAKATRQDRLNVLDRELARQRAHLERLIDELLETPKGSESYRPLIERQRRIEDTLRLLKAKRASFDAKPEVGLSPLAAAEVERFAQEVADGLGGATVSERRWVLERLRLTGKVSLDHEGMRFGRIGHRYSFELEAVVDLNASSRALAVHPTTWSLTSPAACMNA